MCRTLNNLATCRNKSLTRDKSQNSNLSWQSETESPKKDKEESGKHEKVE